MAKRGTKRKRRDEVAEELERLRGIAVGGYAEIVIVTEDDHDDPDMRTALGRQWGHVQ